MHSSCETLTYSMGSEYRKVLYLCALQWGLCGSCGPHDRAGYPLPTGDGNGFPGVGSHAHRRAPSGGHNSSHHHSGHYSAIDHSRSPFSFEPNDSSSPAEGSSGGSDARSKRRRNGAASSRQSTVLEVLLEPNLLPHAKNVK